MLLGATAQADVMSFNVTATPAAGTNITTAGQSYGGGIGTVTTFTKGTNGTISFNHSGGIASDYTLLFAFNGAFAGESLATFVYQGGTPLTTDVAFPSANTATFSVGNANTTYTFNYTTSADASANVPEPSSFAALAICGIGFIAVRRRRLKA